jgi:hypothetical protein
MARGRPGSAPVLLRERPVRGRTASRDRHRLADRLDRRRARRRHRLLRRDGSDRWQDCDDSDSDRLRRHARPPRVDPCLAWHGDRGRSGRRDRRPERRTRYSRAVRLSRDSRGLGRPGLPRPTSIPAAAPAAAGPARGGRSGACAAGRGARAGRADSLARRGGDASAGRAAGGGARACADAGGRRRRGEPARRSRACRRRQLERRRGGCWLDGDAERCGCFGVPGGSDLGARAGRRAAAGRRFGGRRNRGAVGVSRACALGVGSHGASARGRVRRQLH